MTELALRTAGHRAARYTSPHLVRLNERFVIDGREVDDVGLERAAARVQQAAEMLVAAGTLQNLPTFFDVHDGHRLRAVPRGGCVARRTRGRPRRPARRHEHRLCPIAAAIVSIDFDHQEQLGHTLASIAAEKAGIVRPGIPVVCGRLPPEALGVIAGICTREGARLVPSDLDVTIAPTSDPEVVTVTTRRIAVPSVRLSLRGAHQVNNAAVALGLLDELDALGFSTPTTAVRQACRMRCGQGVSSACTVDGCHVILDAAHNPAGARALAAYVREAHPSGVALVFGAMKDKAVVEMLSRTCAGGRADDLHDRADAARDGGRRDRRPRASDATRGSRSSRIPSSRSRAPATAASPRSSWPARSSSSGPSANGWPMVFCGDFIAPADPSTVMLRTGLLVLVVLAAMAWPASAQEPPGGCKVWQTNARTDVLDYDHEALSTDP